jgi:hypothetical protein
MMYLSLSLSAQHTYTEMDTVWSQGDISIDRQQH